MGGSEYYEYFHRITGGTVPQVDLKVDRQNRCYTEPHKNRPGKFAPMIAQKGGIAVALAEMATAGSIGFKVQT